MPTECPPKQPEPAPKPSGPDPEAVRLALAEIDEAERKYKAGEIKASIYATLVFMERQHPLAAARAWLALQDGEAHE